MVNTTPTESEEQIKLVDYLSILESQWKVLWFCFSGNWQYQKSIQVRMKMKQEWIRAGMPDGLIVFRENLVFIELKRKKWWSLTDEQKNAIAKINEMWDKQWVVMAFVAYGFEEAKEIVDKFI